MQSTDFLGMESGAFNPFVIFKISLICVAANRSSVNEKIVEANCFIS